MSNCRILLRAIRRLAVAGFLLCSLIQPMAGPAVAAAQIDDDDVYPREDAAIARQVSGQTVTIRPLKRVKTPDGDDAVAERIIVAFNAAMKAVDVGDAHLAAPRAGAGKARPVLELGNNTFLVDVSGAPSLERALDAYRADRRVHSADFDLIGEAADTPNDPNFAQQWGMTTIDAPTAWNRTHGTMGTLTPSQRQTWLGGSVGPPTTAPTLST